MRTIAKLTLPVLAIMALAGCSGSGPEINGNEVVVHTAQMDVSFVSGESFANTYMLFGGTHMTQTNAFAPFILAGLEINAARWIYSRYPDFHMCASEGAPIAKREVKDLQIVAASGKVAKGLKKALKADRDAINNGGDRVAVRIEGRVMQLKSMVVREVNEDITHELPRESFRQYLLVESVEIVDSKQALES